jgi:hypothetical protein
MCYSGLRTPEHASFGGLELNSVGIHCGVNAVISAYSFLLIEK